MTLTKDGSEVVTTGDSTGGAVAGDTVVVVTEVVCSLDLCVSGLDHKDTGLRARRGRIHTRWSIWTHFRHVRRHQ